MCAHNMISLTITFWSLLGVVFNLIGIAQGSPGATKSVAFSYCCTGPSLRVLYAPRLTLGFVLTSYSLSYDSTGTVCSYTATQIMSI